jgi:uncharacterized damage-inducible protein DinB
MSGFRDEFLWELEIAERQLMALAESIPDEKYEWWPASGARSVCEVFVHVATGNFMLLEAIGSRPPVHLYGEVTVTGPEGVWALVPRSDELAREVRDKPSVIKLLRESLDAVDEVLARASDESFDEPRQFFGHDTTVRRVYLRLLVHLHEHMGQMIAYTRSMGLPAPWPDWRPDRR